MECRRKKRHQDNQQRDKNEQKNEKIGHVFYVPSYDWLDNNTGSVKQPDDDQGDKLRF